MRVVVRLSIALATAAGAASSALELPLTALTERAGPAVGQVTGVHPVSGRRFAQVMGFQGAPWLDREERDIEEEPDRAIDALELRAGDVVADVGAGSGYMSVRLAKRV